MIVTISTNDFLLVFPEIENLYKQEMVYHINVSLKIVKLYKYADEVYNYILNRMKVLIPNLTKEGYILSDNERKIYDEILLSMISIDNQEITKEELVNVDKCLITPRGLERLLRLF